MQLRSVNLNLFRSMQTLLDGRRACDPSVILTKPVALDFRTTPFCSCAGDPDELMAKRQGAEACKNAAPSGPVSRQDPCLCQGEYLLLAMRPNVKKPREPRKRSDSLTVNGVSTPHFKDGVCTYALRIWTFGHCRTRRHGKEAKGHGLKLSTVPL